MRLLKLTHLLKRFCGTGTAQCEFCYIATVVTLLNRGLSEKAKTALQASNEAQQRTELLFELILSTRKFDTISVRECHRICNELAEVGIDLHLHRDR